MIALYLTHKAGDLIVKELLKFVEEVKWEDFMSVLDAVLCNGEEPKVLIAGSANFSNEDAVLSILSQLIDSEVIPTNFEIISTEYDGMSSVIARTNELKHTVFPIRWVDISVPNCKVATSAKHGKYNLLAPINRNKVLASTATVAVIYWDGKCSYTQSLISVLHEAKVDTHIVKY